MEQLLIIVICYLFASYLIGAVMFFWHLRKLLKLRNKAIQIQSTCGTDMSVLINIGGTLKTMVVVFIGSPIIVSDSIIHFVVNLWYKLTGKPTQSDI